MTTLQEESHCQTSESSDVISMEIDLGVHFPLNISVNYTFTGYYNGVGIEVRSDEAIGLLYHMGVFGKGSESRSRPKSSENVEIPFMRKRQYLKRSQWVKKYSKNHGMSEADQFMKDIDDFTSEILKDKIYTSQKDVVDLVSSDDEDVSHLDNTIINTPSFNDKDNIVVVVPNSESEDDNYFAHLKPKCCFNKVKLEEKLMLTAQEAFFLMYGFGYLQVFHNAQALSVEECWDLFSKGDHKFVEKYVVYHYYRAKGYIVKPGIKFGGDYLLYKEGPETNHADYIVVIRFNDSQLEWTSILGHVRVANTTAKKVLIAEVIKSTKNVLQMPQDLSKYSVREVLLDRNIPMTINEDID